MYKNLNAESLGIVGRQSELIELALTFGFRSMDIDIDELVRRVERQSVEQAVRFLKGAPVSVGSFTLPESWRGDEAGFQASLVQLKSAATAAAAAETKRCIVTIEPASDMLPYHENFELHRQRLGEVASLLAEFDIQLGLDLCASPVRRNGQFQFIQQVDELLTFFKATSSSNIGLVLDTWDWRLGGGSLQQIGELAEGQIVLVRVADIAPAADLSVIDETQRQLPSEDGIVDNVGIIKLLDEHNYQGAVELNVSPALFEGVTRDDTVKQAKASLESLFTSAGLTKDGERAPVSADA